MLIYIFQKKCLIKKLRIDTVHQKYFSPGVDYTSYKYKKFFREA
jgi:hypothetical protein